MIIIICGLPGIGKSTLARELAPLLDAITLSTDQIRKELIAHPNYSRGERRLVFNVMVLLAKYLHQSNINCILDATFNKKYSRYMVKENLKLSNDEFHIIECRCPEKIILSRLANRKKDYSDADILVYFKMKNIYEPVTGKHIEVDTSLEPKRNAQWIAKKLLK